MVAGERGTRRQVRASEEQGATGVRGARGEGGSHVKWWGGCGLA